MKHILLSLLLLLPGFAYAADPVLQDATERESYYSGLICKELYNGFEKSLPSGIRPDCQTGFVVMEFDWAVRSKMYECIGQSLVYAEESGLHPVCVLLARNEKELEFARSLDFEPFDIILRVIDARRYNP